MLKKFCLATALLCALAGCAAPEPPAPAARVTVCYPGCKSCEYCTESGCKKYSQCP